MNLHKNIIIIIHQKVLQIERRFYVWNCLNKHFDVACFVFTSITVPYYGLCVCVFFLGGGGWQYDDWKNPFFS